MKLFIDTTDSEKVVVGLDGKMFESVSKREKAQRLLPFIDEVLKKQEKSIDDISEVEVKTGPGSFTGIRVGVSVANAIGWSQGVKVNGKDLRKGEVYSIYY